MSRFREDNAPKAVRKLCPKCHYRLVHLRDFDGTSSLDAPTSEIYGANQNETASIVRMGLFGVGLRLVVSLFSGLQQGQSKAHRHAQVQRLRQDILPADPDARICPICLHLVMTGE